MGRAPCCDKASVKKGPWSPEEDAKLKAYMEEHGTGGNWIALPHKVGLKRCGKSCRLRWLNYLRPNIKHGGFSEEEDQIICSLYISIGSRWSIIAAQLPGRTDNDIKNYWNTKLKKKLLGKRRDSSQSSKRLSIDQAAADGAANHQTTLQPLISTSALERMQLHMQLQGLYNPFSLWPNHIHPLQSQQTDHAVATSPAPQASGISTPVLIQQKSHDHQDAFAMGSINEILSSKIMQEGSTLGLIQSPTPKFDSFAAELGDMIIYSKNSTTTFDQMQEDHHHHQLSDLDCYKEIIYGDQKEMSSTAWWPSNAFQTSVLQTEPKTLLQEHTQQYDIYKHRDYNSNYKLLE